VSDLRATDRTRVRRLAARGSFDRAAANAILDEALVAHLALVRDGAPVVLPILHHRDGDRLCFHGHIRNAMLNAACEADEVCCTVTLLDGLVLAPTLFQHSANYRSVVLFGKAMRVDDADEKRRILHGLVEHVIPGRSADCPPMTDAELAATIVVAMPIDEGSVKTRTGGPGGVEAAGAAGGAAEGPWLGVLPLALGPGAPDAAGPAGAAPRPAPSYVAEWRRGSGGGPTPPPPR
jgi:hypothetical protein